LGTRVSTRSGTSVASRQCDMAFFVHFEQELIVANRFQKKHARAQLTAGAGAPQIAGDLSHYEISEAATQAKNERLKALRLARDAEIAAAAPPPAPARRRSVKKPVGPTGNLSAWLKDREGSGHNS
jgi:hypothetical protein